MVSPAVERLGRDLAGRLKVVKLNVDEAPALSARFQVRGIPLLVVFRDGPRPTAWQGPSRSSSSGPGSSPHLVIAGERAASGERA